MVLELRPCLVDTGEHPKRDPRQVRLSECWANQSGRSGEIRTPDPLLPKQVRYQAALRSALLEIRRSPSTLAGALGRPPSGVATFGKGATYSHSHRALQAPQVRKYSAQRKPPHRITTGLLAPARSFLSGPLNEPQHSSHVSRQSGVTKLMMSDVRTPLIGISSARIINT